METIYLNNEYHLVVTKGKTVCSLDFLQMSADGIKRCLFDVCDKAPTCPECLKRHFIDYREKDNDFKTLLGGLDFLIRSYGKCNTPGRHDQVTKEEREGSFPFIPSSIKRSFSDLKDIKSYLEKETRWSGNHVKHSFFLDAGCGIGNVMLTAKMHDLCTYRHGIEFFDETADKAEIWLNTKRAVYDLKIIREDILKFNNYHKYDIIYFFCPFITSRLQVMFEERLEDKMKVGAILLANSKQSDAILKDYRFERVELKVKFAIYISGIYIKIKDGIREVSSLDKFEFSDHTTQNVKLIKEKYNVM